MNDQHAQQPHMQRTQAESPVVRAVTFDFHNTIAHCDQWFQLEIRTLVVAVLDHFAARDDLAVTEEMREEARYLYRELRTQIGEHGNELDATKCTLWVLRRMQPSVSLDEIAVAQAIDTLMAATLDEAQPVPGALESIRALRADGISLGVISAAVHHDFLEWTLTRFGIRDAFDVVVTTASAGFYKTRPELYETTAAAMGFAPQDTLHIGDSYRLDVLGAQAAGLHAAWYNRGEGGGVVGEPHAAFVVTSMADLPGALQQFTQRQSS